MPPIFDSVWNTYVKDSIPLISALIGAFGGGIVSGFVVHWLTRSREREGWVRDCEKEEWKELFMALTKSETTLAAFSAAYASGIQEERQKALDAFTVASREANLMLRSRLFIN